MSVCPFVSGEEGRTKYKYHGHGAWLLHASQTSKVAISSELTSTPVTFVGEDSVTFRDDEEWCSIFDGTEHPHAVGAVKVKRGVLSLRGAAIHTGPTDISVKTH
jgi:hypothetical protein